MLLECNPETVAKLKSMMDQSRRYDRARMTAQELLITCAMVSVEDHSAHPMIGEAVALLQQARDKVADFVDMQQERQNFVMAELERSQKENGWTPEELRAAYRGELQCADDGN